MISLVELMEQRDDIIRKNHELHIYLMESRRIQGDISQITYRHNSGIYVSDGQFKRMATLKRELREKNSELRRCHGLSPGRVENQIREYDHTLKKIDKQLDEMTKEQQFEQQPPEPEDALGKIVEERLRLKGLEDRLTETGIQLLKEQAAQDASGHDIPIWSSSLQPLPEYDGLYEALKEQDTGRQPQELCRDDDRDR